MVKDEGVKVPGQQPNKLTYFYLNGLLHKKLLIDRTRDSVTTWCYPLGKRVTYTYSDVKKRKEPAFTGLEVSAMIGRSPRTLKRLINDGDIEPPQHTYGLNEKRIKYKFMWSEADIMNLHEHLANTHRGRPRHDGIQRNTGIPTRKELRAMIKQENILYTLTKDGDFIPVWKAQDFN